jgi:hypothetical protein
MTFPKWIDKRPQYNLRYVAPRLMIGAENSPELAKADVIVDLYGSSTQRTGRQGRRIIPLDPIMPPGVRQAYAKARIVHRIPFEDGDPFPPGYLQAILWTVCPALQAKKRVLIHCQAGLSRSASAAYAALRVCDFIRSGSILPHKEALRRVQVGKNPQWPKTVTLESARSLVEEGRLQGRQGWAGGLGG